jgi:hypothetical protein
MSVWDCLTPSHIKIKPHGRVIAQPGIAHTVNVFAPVDEQPSRAEDVVEAAAYAKLAGSVNRRRMCTVKEGPNEVASMQQADAKSPA